MNMLLLEPGDFVASGVARISGRRFRQLTGVIQAEPGKLLRAGVLNGACGRAELLSCDAETAALRFIPESAPPPPPPVSLVIALQRPQTFMKVLHAAVSLGVKKIHFIHTFKVEKSYWQSSRLAPEALEEEIRLALEQSADPVAPELKFHRRFKPFVEDELDAILAGSVGLFGDPAGTATPPPPGTPVTLALGPEGGFTDYEARTLGEHRFTGLSLGPRILRTEFALAALLGKLVL